jgi:hypothetical protein
MEVIMTDRNHTSEADKRAKDNRKKLEEQLEEGLEESFPASDPASVTLPSPHLPPEPVPPRRHKRQS